MTLLPVKRVHLIAALAAGLVFRLFFIWRLPYFGGDALTYDEIARHWLDQGIYGLTYHGQLIPVDARMPGYPAFLAAIYTVFGRSHLAVVIVQSILDLATCMLIAMLATRLASEARSAGVATFALWLAVLCPFTARYTVVLFSEVLAIFFSTLALWLFLAAHARAESSQVLEAKARGNPSGLFFAGLAVGFGTLVRPETPLLLIALGLVLLVRWRRRADWPRLFRAGALLTVGLILPLLPWAMRNWQTFHRVQFLAPRYAELEVELPGGYVPRGFYAWTKTWLVRYRDVFLTLWKLGHPIRFEDLPPSAFDSNEERERVAALIARYNQGLRFSPAIDAEFAQLARERTRRHPFRSYLWIPLQRAATMWLMPRFGPGPASLLMRMGLGPRSAESLATFALWVVSCLYLGLALWGAWRGRAHPATAFLVTFLLVRTWFFAQVHETPEPRYLLECFPAVMALAAQVWNYSPRG